jgi:hypothetical protein
MMLTRSVRASYVPPERGTSREKALCGGQRSVCRAVGTGRCSSTRARCGVSTSSACCEGSNASRACRGGSIAAGLLASRWDSLEFNPDDVAQNFPEAVVRPLREMAHRTIDWKAALARKVVPGVRGRRLAHVYRQLLGDCSLRDLPDEPSFVFNATSLQAGGLWRFSKTQMGDGCVDGLVTDPGRTGCSSCRSVVRVPAIPLAGSPRSR